MTMRTRGLVGMLWLAVLAGVGFALVHIGTYGLTIFVLFPVFLGALSSWVFQPSSGSLAATWGALAALAGLFSFLLAGAEGAMCIAMAAPLAFPLGAFGGWLVYRGGSSKKATRGMTMLLFMPPATLTWDATAPPAVFQVRTSIEIAAPPGKGLEIRRSVPSVARTTGMVLSRRSGVSNPNPY